jgi:hypothetical protein
VLKGFGVGGEPGAPTTKSGLGIDLPISNIGFDFGNGEPTIGNEDPTTGSEDPTTEPDTCPQVWYDISRDLKQSFQGCNQLAANAIRFAFHDAGKNNTFDCVEASHS